jgi:hypothetical protein
MPAPLLPSDTSPDAEQRLIARWREMSAGQKLELALSMSHTVRQLALAGVRKRFPGATPRELQLRFAILMLGPDLAQAAYPDAARLDPP